MLVSRSRKSFRPPHRSKFVPSSPQKMESLEGVFVRGMSARHLQPGASMEYGVTAQPGRNIIRTLTTGEQTATAPTTLMLQLLSSLSRELLAFRRPYRLFRQPMGRLLLGPAASDCFPRGRLSTSALNFATRCTYFVDTTVGRRHSCIIVSPSVARPGRRSGIPGRAINFPTFHLEFLPLVLCDSLQGFWSCL